MAPTETLPGLIAHPRPRPYPFGPTSLADILDAGLGTHPEQVALVDGDRTWTWSELDAAVTDLATSIAPQQPIGWELGNSAEAVIGALATFRAGGIWVGGCSAEDRARVETHLGPIRMVSSVNDTTPGDHVAPVIDPHQPAVITFTSGTSGRPKAVVHSQHNLLWPGLVSVELEPPRSGERIGTPLSLGIANIMALGPISALLRGSTAVMMSRTHATGFADDVATYGITRSFVVATMLHDLLVDPTIDPSLLQTLDRVIVGGSPANPELLHSFLDRFSIRPTLSYGMSEAPTGVVRESLNDPIGSGRGFPLPHVEAAINSSNNNDDNNEAVGEIHLRAARSGPWAQCWTPTLGYLGERERTDALFANGWLRTGDIGVLDGDGALAVTGRLSDVIIRGGANIDPTSVEGDLAQLAWIDDVLCVGVDDERLGQQVGVLIVLNPNHPAPPDAQQLASLQSAAASPIDLHAVIEAIPRNSMGKRVREWNSAIQATDTLEG